MRKLGLSTILWGLGMGILLVGCASSAIKSSWVDPQFRFANYKKVMVWAIAKEDVARRTFEDQCAKSWSQYGVTAVPSYPVFPGPDRPTQDALGQYLTSNNIGAVLVVQVKSSNTVVVQNPAVTTTTYQPSMVGGGYGGGYYGYAEASYTQVNQPATTSEYQVLTIASRLFDTATQKNIAIIETETMVQGSVNALIQDLVKTVTKALVQQ